MKHETTSLIPAGYTYQLGAPMGQLAAVAAQILCDWLTNPTSPVKHLPHTSPQHPISGTNQPHHPIQDPIAAFSTVSGAMPAFAVSGVHLALGLASCSTLQQLHKPQ